MTTLIEKKREYENQKIEKYAYMAQMLQSHNKLFEYIDLIDESNVEKIEILKDGVLFTLKNTNIKLYSVKDDFAITPFTMLNFGCYEEKLWDKTSKLLNNPKVIFDIGGNIGYFSLYFSRLFPNAKIYAFEPVPNNFKFLNKNLKANAANNISAYNFGMSREKAEKTMFWNPSSCGTSSLVPILDNTVEIKCKFETLDNFVAENDIKNIDLIKCDVEGAEKFVYEGGLKTIEKFKPVIYSEMLRKWSAKFNYHPNDIINLLKPLGYECFAISETTYEKITEVTDETVETNYIFKQA